MSEPACAFPGCTEPLRHEHRLRRWDMTTNHFWAEMGEADIRLLNQARAGYDWPMLVFTATPTSPPTPQPPEQLTWSAEAGIHPVPTEEPS